MKPTLKMAVGELFLMYWARLSDALKPLPETAQFLDVPTGFNKELQHSDGG